MIGDHNFAAHQNVVSDLNQMRGRYMHVVADTNMLTKDDFGRKGLLVKSRDGLQPQPFSR
jgi:hypothetical protein